MHRATGRPWAMDLVLNEPEFRDRRDAGSALARHLDRHRGRDDALVLALPRGGVPVGFEVAAGLDLPLDVFLIRKLGVPGREELAMGAVASGGVRVLEERVIAALEIDETMIATVAVEEQRRLEEGERRYRGGRPPTALSGRAVLVVDDGLATGSSMRAALRAVRSRDPAEVVAAVPVAPRETCESLQEEADEVICVCTPAPFQAVGAWYEDFGQVSDDQVRELLERAGREHGAAPVTSASWGD